MASFKEPQSDVDVVAEKNVSASDSYDSAIVKDWEDAEEKKLKFKLDTILFPILGVAFFPLQIDRGNISAALTSTITEDLNITTNQINVGTQLLSAGIVISEIPSTWLSGQLFAWGLVATFQCFIKSYPAYLVTRLLLGLLEGGFIPGALYYLSTWYKRGKTSLRITLFFFGQMLSGATSSLISAGLLTLAGKGGLAGWQWIFLIEGVITLGIAVIFTFLVPPKAGDGPPLLSAGRWSYLTPRESHIAVKRVLLDDPSKEAGHIWKTVREPRIIQHFLITLVVMTASQGFTQYTPSMIKSFGFGVVRANALASVPVYCSMLWVLVLSYLADKLGHRGPFVLLAITWNVISWACLRVTPASSGRWHRYGVIAAANVSYVSMHILNVGWLSVYCKSPQQRSVAMAIIIMGANLAGISGSQIFRTDDAPLYHRALTIICILAGVSWVLALAMNVQSCLWHQKKKPTESAEQTDV